MSGLKAVQSVFALPARLFFTFVLLAFPFLAGLSAASPWYIIAIFPVFILADVMGKWRLQFQGKPASELLTFLPKALAAQPVVVGVIYLLGRGVGSLSGAPQTLPFGPSVNWEMIGLYMVVIVALSLILLYLERDKASLEDMVEVEINKAMAVSGLPMSDDPGIEAPVEDVTAETLFDGHHYSNSDFDAEKDENVLNEAKAYVNEADIAETEARLGVTLPNGLRALYLLQNGGSVRHVYSGDKSAPSEDDQDPFSGYEELYPLDRLRSVHEAVKDYAYEDQLEMFPKGAKQLIVLSQYYRETLFLDYRAGGRAPRVGFYDFDQSDDLQEDAWEDEATFWPDFETFFATLYRQRRYG